MKKIFGILVVALLMGTVAVHADVTAQVAITVQSQSGASDELYLIEMSDASAGYDNSWDVTKIIKTGATDINIYATIDEDLFSTYATDDLNGTPIVFQGNKEESEYEFSFNSVSGTQLYLRDAELDTIVPIAEKGGYMFVCEPGGIIADRFSIRSSMDSPTGGDDTMTAYFINSQGWDVRAYIYDWKDENWETVTDDVTTTKAEEMINGFEVYMYQFSAGLEKPHFLFMNGTINDGAARTDYQPYSSDRPFFCLDGTIDSSGYASGVWYESPEAYLAAVNDTINPTESETEHVQIGDLYYNLDVVNRTAAVTFQEEYSQSNYSGLATIVIPSTIEYNVVTYSVTNIGERAFTHCSDLTSVFIPNSIITIGRGAFSDSYNLTSLTIPNSVLSIEEYAFEYCLSLTSITSEAITPPTCGTDVFSNVNTSIPLYVPTESVEAYQKADGWGEFTNILPIPGTDLECEPVEMSEDATICEGNMYIWRDMTYAETGVYRDTAWSVSGVCDSVHYVLNLTVQPQAETILDTVFITEGEAYDWNGTSLTESGTYRDTLAAFNGCDSIVTLILIVNQPEQCIIARGTCGDSLTWVLDCDSVLTISGNGAMTDWNSDEEVPWFSYREEITSVNIGNSVTSIGSLAFENCNNLLHVELPDSLTSIGQYSFRGCINLSEIFIPANVTYIEYWAFNNCGKLTSIIVEESNKIYDSRHQCNAIIETGTNTLIAGCSNSVIPNDITEIGMGAFAYCTNLTSVDIPNSVTSIGYHAFEECNNLKNLVLGSSVTNIEEAAFGDCTSLTSINIPASVTLIGKWAFLRCTGLTTIIVEEGNKMYDSRNNCNGIIETSSNTLIVGCQTTVIPSSVTSIGSDVFNGHSYLTSFNIPDNIISIGDRAFQFCHWLTSIVISENVTNIGERAFVGCGQEAEFEITCTAVTPPTCGNDVFYDVNKSIPLYVPEESIEAYKAAEGWSEFTNILAIGSEPVETEHVLIGDLYYNLDVENRTAEVTYQKQYTYQNYSGLTAATIPATIEVNAATYSVTSIGEAAFYGSQYMEEVIIPSSITIIGSSAFLGCSGLTSVIIPDSVTSIKDNAFNYCSGLTSITIPSSVTSIEDAAFMNCSGLRSIVVENGNRIYDSRDNCNAIIETETNTLIAGCLLTIIPESVTSIGYGAFTGCTDMTSLTIPNSIKSIGISAFSGCSGLENITIPNSVEEIGNMAFTNCTNLTSITIPNSVTSIGNLVFQYCKNLTTITCEATTPPTCGMMVFDDVDKSIPVYVPEESIDAYKAADEWKEFTNIKAIGSEPEVEKVYSVVGDGGLIGSDWNAENTRTEMTLQEDSTWIYVIDSVLLEAGAEYRYKVIANHVWLEEQYPNDSTNYSILVETRGYYSVVFTLVSGEGATAEVTFLHGVVEKPVYSIPAGCAIDGNFEDWEKVPSEILAEAQSDENAQLEALYQIKFFTNEDYIYFYLEFDSASYTYTENNKEVIGKAVNPIDIFIDIDNDPFTGYTPYQWYSSSADYLIEGLLSEGLDLFKFTGNTQDEWGWDYTDASGAIITSEKVQLPNGHTAVEGRILIAAFPNNFKSLKVGVSTSNSQWGETGVLPQITVTEDGNEIQPMLEVPLNYGANEEPCETTTIHISDSIKAGETYTYNGRELTEAGEYEFHIAQEGGCETIVILTLTVIEPEPTISVFGKDVVIIDPTDSTATMDEVDVFGDSTLVYNPQENTLTFSSLTLEVGDSVSTAISYTGTETLTIVLCDSSTIFADTVISSMGDVVVTGDGVLVAEAVVPIIGVPTASILFDSVTMHVRSLKSPATVRRRIRGIKVIDEDGGPALSGFATVDYNKTAVTPPDAEYGEVEVSDSEVAGAPSRVINALYVVNPAGERVPLSEFDLTAIADDIPESIESTQTEQLFDPAQPMYNILGIRVDATYKGIVIQNGRSYLR